jgi:hypothetical protein
LRSLEHFEKARREGKSVKAYASAHGISAQQIYDTVGRPRLMPPPTLMMNQRFAVAAVLDGDVAPGL